MPVLLAGMIGAGLFIALLDEARPWRAIAWALLALPLLIAGLAWCGWWAPSTTSDRRGGSATTARRRSRRP